MGTYFCRENDERQEIKSKHLHELYKSTNISLMKQNMGMTNKTYFPCQYLGRGVYGSTIEVFLKEKKQEKYAQKITKIEWIRQSFLFLNSALFQQYNHSLYFVHTFSIRTLGNKLYVVNEKLQLGNMYTYMKKFQKFIDYSVLKELSIRLVLILEKIHSKNIIYRSLRPENILFVDNEGQFRLSELCFSVVGENQKSYVGAAVYTPPELLAQGETLIDKSIDFWMLGVLIYQLMVGHTPFEGQNLAQVKDNILNFHSDSLKFPEQMHICEDLQDFLKNLLQPDPSTRMGIQQIKRHKFFHGETLDEYRGERTFLNIKENHLKYQNIPPNRIIFSNTDKTQPFMARFTELVFDQKCVLNSN